MKRFWCTRYIIDSIKYYKSISIKTVNLIFFVIFIYTNRFFGFAL